MLNNINLSLYSTRRSLAPVLVLHVMCKKLNQHPFLSWKKGTQIYMSPKVLKIINKLSQTLQFTKFWATPKHLCNFVYKVL